MTTLFVYTVHSLCARGHFPSLCTRTDTLLVYTCTLLVYMNISRAIKTSFTYMDTLPHVHRYFFCVRGHSLRIHMYNLHVDNPLLYTNTLIIYTNTLTVYTDMQP